jgi:RNA polymerase sigma-70 factor (ECF subfamily)
MKSQRPALVRTKSLRVASRLVLSMSVVEGYTGDEIAEICGINANTVRSLISRAKKKLRMEIDS